MFTGIVAAVGKIESVKPLEGGSFAGVRLDINAGGLPLADVGLGATNFRVDVSRESLNKTVGLDTTTEVNLEKALTLNERLGGHLVSGHVDGLGVVRKFEPVGESWELVIESPHELAKFLAYKGSIVVNGVSLTVNRVTDIGTGADLVCQFSINLIPHTIAVTTLKHLKVDAKVNLEIDLIARYVERMVSVGAATK
jgi:riboflavin synthase